MKNFILLAGFLSAVFITLLVTLPRVSSSEFDDEVIDSKENTTENDTQDITTEISKDITTEEDIKATEIVTEIPDLPTTDNPTDNKCSPSGWPCVPNKSRKPIKTVMECCSGTCQFEDGWIDAVCL